MFLEKVNTPGDLKALSIPQLRWLCEEIRGRLITTLSHTGGHLASNLGTVELTVALHKVFESPTDQILWDVGHQCYTHKLLTGRKELFDTLRTENGLSGFPKRRESAHDAFVAGHSGNSISAALGLLTAKELLGEPGQVIAVIGDGSLGNGLAYEGLNNAGRSHKNLIVILNDNEMSISKNVGGLAKYLAKIRARSSYFKLKDVTEKTIKSIPLVGYPLRDTLSASKSLLRQALYHSNLFEDFGFAYLGPVDGHNLESLCDVLERAKGENQPVVVHVETKKGKGYAHAERSPSLYHGVGPFDILSGKPLSTGGENFSSVFGETLLSMAEQDSRICAISAAMVDGTGLESFFKAFPKRSFDVGIAESHAVTFGAGLAAKGLRPVFAVYSTFLQRAYDQLVHDCALEGEHLVLAVDRAGIVGEDGETHQGILDIPFLTTIPGATVYSPASFEELRLCLPKAVGEDSGLVALRYPRGGEPPLPTAYRVTATDFTFWKNDCKDILLITYGRLMGQVAEAAEILAAKGRPVSVLKLTTVFPIDARAVKIALRYRRVLFFEEGMAQGSIAHHFGVELLKRRFHGSYQVHAIDAFVPHAPLQKTLESLGLDSASIVGLVLGEVGE